MRNAIVVGILASMVFAAPNPATVSSAWASLNASVYFPLRSGNSWTYLVNNSELQTTIVLPGTTTINGVPTKAMQDSTGFTQYFTNDTDGIRLHREFDPAGIDATFNPPVKFANAVADVGQVVTGSGIANVTIAGVGSGSLSYSATSTIEATENISAPLGNYQALRLRTSVTLTGSIAGVPINAVTTQVIWAVNHMGVVRADETATVNGSTSTETGVLTATSVTPERDFNADGKADILWRNVATGDIAVFLMNGLTLMDSAVVGTVNPAWSVVGVGDFNGDGKADILWRNAATGDNAIFLMNGFTILSSALIGNINPAWSVVGVGDFDGDGKADILWRNATTGDNAIFLMDGFTVARSQLIGSINPAWSVVGIRDFNGDGKADILWRKTSTGDNAIFLMDGTTLTSSALLPSVPTDWTVAGVGDFNGDGRADILWRNTSTGDNAIFLMNGLSLANSALIPAVSNLDWVVAGVADYNGDGKADILWRNTSTGDNAIFLMDGTTLTRSALIPSVPTNWAVISE